MLESLIITLREGIEAALIVGIALAYLQKIGRTDLGKYVVAGVVAAVLLSAILAAIFQRININQEVFEGAVMLVAAVFVGTFMEWMRRHAHKLRQGIQTRIDVLLAKKSSVFATWGLFAFATVMILREGVETVLFLSAIAVTTEAMWSFLGGMLGLSVSVIFAVLFIKGSVRVDLPRFFRVTNVVLFIFIIQLLFNAYHELSEAGILPTTSAVMATVGPIVRNNTLFAIAILGLPLIIFLTPSKMQPAVASTTENPAERRKIVARARQQQRWQRLAGVSGLVVICFLCLNFVYAHGPVALSPAEPVTSRNNAVLLPAARFEDGLLHRFSFGEDEKTLRFVAVKIGAGKFGLAFDACENCGDQGYYQEGPAILCRNCVAEINPSTIGLTGGCNPIPLPFTVQADTIRISLDDLRSGMKYFRQP
jgi:FTR1 family protein